MRSLEVGVRRFWPARFGISQISGDFADDLQNSFFFLGGLEKKRNFGGRIQLKILMENYYGYIG